MADCPNCGKKGRGDHQGHPARALQVHVREHDPLVSFIEVVDMKAGSDDELAIIMNEMYPIFIGKLAALLEARGDPDPYGKAMLLGLGVGE